jgi:hypothetical protein
MRGRARVVHACVIYQGVSGCGTVHRVGKTHVYNFRSAISYETADRCLFDAIPSSKTRDSPESLPKLPGRRRRPANIHCYIAAGLYLPSVMRSGVGEIVIGVDTSSSIGTHELEQFAGKISAIAEEAQPESIHVVYCDAAMQSWQQFGRSETISLNRKAAEVWSTVGQGLDALW